MSTVYLLWAEGTDRFKVGYTGGSVDARASQLETGCPYPIRILGERHWNSAGERRLHRLLDAYRVHREWFALPEAIVWPLLRFFRVDLLPADGEVMNGTPVGLRA
ncbi:GIY-YIG nuclease family protein [Methylobacterium sp. NMS14P]|uniref:GIY-YIG nuclease family protein n=1 Tax=Methylobacterium sp. NMS14P TaxID=2894310 RepID=UPI003FD5C025